MKKLFPYLLLLLVLNSCQKKNQDVIEIYLTKERIPNNIGIPIQEYFRINNNDSSGINQFSEKYEFMTVDKSSQQLIDLGNFNFELNDLEQHPFITNDEILGFDNESAELFLKKEVVDKFSKLKYTTQFVLFINKKPIINGYLETGFSSRRFNDTYTGFYITPDKKRKSDSFSLILLYGDIESKATIPDFKSLNPDFYQVFQTRN